MSASQRMLALHEVLLRQQALALSSYLMQDVATRVQSNEKLLPVLRKQIEGFWPKSGERLKVGKDGKLSLNFHGFGSQVRDLSPLRGCEGQGICPLCPGPLGD